MELHNVSLNRLVPIYLMSSYLYYEQDKNVLDDTQFDYLCKKLYDNWDNVEHMHKHLIDKDNLKAGSGYGIEYTNLIVSSANSWYEQSEKK
jgi:NAD-dependent DNA ligase